jgi:peptidoglycan/xylan/chitin deacetylase (PgdA/CDA1 family)
MYVATQFVDQQCPFPWGAPPASWAGLRDVVATGLVSIGSHTHTHRLLDRSGPSPAEVGDDLDRSIALIAEQVGVVAHDSAYPKAVPPSPGAEVQVRQRFRSAALAGNRVNRPGRVDLLRLWRTPVQRSDSDAVFASKARGGMRLDGALRAAAGTVRYRGLEQ